MKMNYDELRVYLTAQVAKQLQVSAEKINPDITFDQLRLDSLSVVALVAEVEDEIGLEIDPSWLYEFRTINKLCEKVCSLEATA